MIDAPPPLTALSTITHAVTASHVGGQRAHHATPAIALTEPGALLARGHAARAWSDRIAIDGAYTPLTTLSRRRWSHRNEEAVTVLIHEHLHVLGSYFTHAPTETTDRRIEEAVVSALAVDVLPRVVKAATGRKSLLWARGAVPTVYRECATRVRVASTVATGSRNWRALAARGWRVALLHAAPNERRHMFTMVGMAPADVCPEAVLA